MGIGPYSGGNLTDVSGSTVNKDEIILLIPPIYSVGWVAPAPGAALIKAVLTQHDFQSRVYDSTADFLRLTEKENPGSVMSVFTSLSMAQFERDLKPEWREFMDGIVDALVSANPRLLGLSMPHRASFLSGLWIAKRVKERIDCRIVVGGSTIVFAALEHIEALTPENVVDAFVFGEGDLSFPRLLNLMLRENLTGEALHGAMEKIPGLAFFRTDADGKRSLVTNGLAEFVSDMDGFLLPIFPITLHCANIRRRYFRFRRPGAAPSGAGFAARRRISPNTECVARKTSSRRWSCSTDATESGNSVLMTIW